MNGSKRKLLVVVPEGSTPEHCQKVKEQMTAKIGDACEIVVGTHKELMLEKGVNLTSPIIENQAVYEIVNRYLDGYIPMNRPSKKELRTSPYAKFDNFHKKKRR